MHGAKCLAARYGPHAISLYLEPPHEPAKVGHK